MNFVKWDEMDKNQGRDLDLTIYPLQFFH